MNHNATASSGSYVAPPPGSAACRGVPSYVAPPPGNIGVCRSPSYIPQGTAAVSGALMASPSYRCMSPSPAVLAPSLPHSLNLSQSADLRVGVAPSSLRCTSPGHSYVAAPPPHGSCFASQLPHTGSLRCSSPDQRRCHVELTKRPFMPVGRPSVSSLGQPTRSGYC